MTASRKKNTFWGFFAALKTEGIMYMIQHYPMPPYLAEFGKDWLTK
jgi:hypothetical protein